MIAVVVVIALVLTNVSARATGETDVAPVGAVGMITQVAFAGAGAVTSLVTGGVSRRPRRKRVGPVCLPRGQRLGASPRAQVGAQLVGAVLGAVVVVPVYFLVVKSYGIGTEAMPAPSAQSWKAMAEAVRGGAARFPHTRCWPGRGARAGAFFALGGAHAHRPLPPLAGRDGDGDAHSGLVFAARSSWAPWRS